jgi:hypothetical protein
MSDYIRAVTLPPLRSRRYAPAITLSPLRPTVTLAPLRLHRYARAVTIAPLRLICYTLGLIDCPVPIRIARLN